HIKCSKRAVAPGNVLLYPNLVFIAELLVRVDILLEHPQPVAQHHYLMKEIIDRNFFWLQALVGRLKTDPSSNPPIAGRHRLCDAPPKTKYLGKRHLLPGICLDFFTYIFRNNLIQLVIRLINFLNTVIDEGNEICRILYSHNYSGTKMSMLQSRSNS